MKEKDRGKRSPPPSFPPDCLELLIVGGLTRQDFSSIVDLLPQFIMDGKLFAFFFFAVLLFKTHFTSAMVDGTNTSALAENIY